MKIKYVIIDKLNNLSETYFERMLNLTYGQGWNKVSIFGPKDPLSNVTTWTREKIRAVRSDKHEGLYYWHYISSLGVDCRLIYTETLGEDLEVCKGHLEVGER